jgi:KAP family P-loop domain
MGISMDIMTPEGVATFQNVTVHGHFDNARPQAERLARALSGIADVHLILVLTPHCAAILLDAVSASSSKNADREILSTTTVFIILMKRAVDIATHTTSQEQELNAEAHELSVWGQFLISAPVQISAMNRLIDDVFMPSLVTPGPILSELNISVGLTTTIGAGFESAIRSISDKTPISADVLGRALLSNHSSVLNGRIERLNLKPLQSFILNRPVSIQNGNTASGFSSKAGPPRRSRRIRREAHGDELGLGIEQYARALATIMRMADGELAFALFGPWGSGKTTLARQTAPLLLNSKDFKEGQNFSDSDALANGEYAVVWHSAWKYRRTPEAWIYLYKSLADHAMKTSGMLGRWAIALRASSKLHGRAPIFLSLSAIAVAALPLPAKLYLAAALASLLGLTAVLYFLSVIGGTTHKVKTLFGKHVKLSSHDDKLGMLALVGDDVRALLGAWIPETMVGSARERRDAKVRLALDASSAALFIALISIIWIFGLHLEGAAKFGAEKELSTIQTVLSNIARPACNADLFEPTSVFCTTSEVGKERTAPPENGSSVLHVLFYVLWLCLALLLLILPMACRTNLPDRVMLIVDDLDRCNPDEMLEIIEAIKLLLEEPFVQQRLQALMLVDEGVLEYAIAQRFERLIRDRNDIPQEASIHDPLRLMREQVITEHVEKLFACHLRVPRLEKEEIEEAVELHAGKELRKRAREERAAAEERLKQAVQGRKKADENEKTIKQMPGQASKHFPVDVVKLREEARAVEAAARAEVDRLKAPTNAKDSTDVSFGDDDLRFDRGEIDAVKRLAPDYFTATNRRPGQRSIKALLFKLQLCLLLLQLRPGDKPTVSITSIVEALKCNNAPDGAESERAVRLVAAQVA